ncbi:BgTH12-06054 [Blumeria graminis f. sp. triticale]|uniref:BgTH12-06054 n=1 Tax=Blumeria graminis f. sp. triticale TaxID=1689686 RepID=A0A9W4GGX7_BLUGR|nr:BgTH12-06054 [Blumeria graminis f. sp. triticale]
MKLFTISGATTLFCILAIVTAMSDYQDPALSPVPDQNSDFIFNCPSGQTYVKDYLMRVVRGARQIMSNPHLHKSYPYHFNDILYNIDGQQWCYPLFGNDLIHDYVVFNTNNEIAGVAHRMTFNREEDEFEACHFI